ncbi:MAG: hypothetical protein IPH04_05435 [Saprospirales bacterium]|nr:hypothetical protein [Saprospirales bacterium]
MTDEEFIKKIECLYKEARKPKYGDQRIKRGRNHSIASQVEDLLASFVLEKLPPQGFELWVDYPISYTSPSKTSNSGRPKQKTLPGCCCRRKQRVHALYPTYDRRKMDLGWKRDLKDYLELTMTTIDELRSVTDTKYKGADAAYQKGKETNPVQVSDQLIWHIVVISDRNIHSTQLESNKNLVCNPSYLGKINLYIFSEGIHPNDGAPTPLC